MKKPHVIIFSGYGLNTEDETKTAFELAGATADIIHINDLIAKPAVLNKAQILVVPGGFSYGDYLRAGAVAGRSPVVEVLPEFVARGGLVLGSCNGFQILCEAKLLPGALMRNECLQYRCQSTYLRVENAETPFTRALRPGQVLRMPISHGEGKFYADWETLRARLTARARDSRQEIERRLAAARREIRELGNYDYLVVNDDLETAVRQVEWIVRARRLRRERTIGAVGRILGKEGEKRDGSSNG